MTTKGRRATTRSPRSKPSTKTRRRTPPSGIANQPSDEERVLQQRLPPRGVADEPSWTRSVEGAEVGELVARTVADVMTPQPTVMEAAQAVSEAARVMRDGDIGTMLVTEEGRLVGILTDRDVVVRVVAEGLNPADTALGVVCSRELAMLNPSDAIETAVARMRESAIRRLPVVEDGRPVGILALGDLAVERDPGSVLGEISAAPPTR